MHTYIHTYIQMYVFMYMHAYMHTSTLRPYMHTSTRPYVHTSLHPVHYITLHYTLHITHYTLHYINTYIYIYVNPNKNTKKPSSFDKNESVFSWMRAWPPCTALGCRAPIMAHRLNGLLKELALPILEESCHRTAHPDV